MKFLTSHLKSLAIVIMGSRGEECVYFCTNINPPERTSCHPTRTLNQNNIFVMTNLIKLCFFFLFEVLDPGFVAVLSVSVFITTGEL